MSHILFLFAVIVPRSSRTAHGSRKYDKVYSCIFCGKDTAKIPRHFKTYHKDEPEVMRMESFSDKKERALELDRLRLKGDFYHNLQVLKCGGELRVLRRPSPDEDISYKQFVPCTYCLGFVQKHDLWRHAMVCHFAKTARNDGNDGTHRNLRFESEMLLHGSNDNERTAFTQSVIAIMRHDERSFVAKQDELIVKFGCSLFESAGSVKATYITEKMRMLARLVIELREVSSQEHLNLAQFICPSKFDFVIQATRNLCSYKIDSTNDNLATFERPSLALKMGHALKRCATILRGVALRRKEKDLKEDADSFVELIDAEWASKVSATALRTLDEGKFNKAPVLPLTADLVKVRDFLVKEMPRVTEEVLRNPQVGTWRNLAELTVARILLLNKRRGNEGSKIQIAQFTDRPKWSEVSMDEMKRSLQPIELELCKR